MRGLGKTFSCVVVAANVLATAPAFADANDLVVSLANRGVTLLGSYTGEAAANVDGGQRQGAAFAGQLLVGADVNLQTMAGLTGTTLHVAVTNRHGQNLADDFIGNSTSVQEIYGGENTRLARLTIEQSLLDGRLVLEGGRTVANISFLGSELCLYFQTNSACGNPTFVFRTSAFTFWPVSSWGGHALAWLSPTTYLHAGVYEVNEKHVSNTDYGFDWSTSGSTGVIVPFAVGLQTTFANSRLPRRYEIGGWYDSSTYTDPLLAANGSFAAVTGQPYATQRGRSGGFVRFEQMVWRPDPASERGLTVFGVAMTGTSGQLTQDRFLELGFVLRGTFRDRDDDTIGFVINQQSYSGIQMLNWTLARAAAGGTGTPFSSQIMTELSYGIQLGRNIRVQPNVQYIIHPDQSNQPARLNNLPNAFVIGLRFDVDLVGLAR